MKIELERKIIEIEFSNVEWGLHPFKEGVDFVNAAFTSALMEYNNGADRIAINNKIIALSENFRNFVAHNLMFTETLTKSLNILYGTDE